MAKRQTRKSISLNRAVHDAVARVAAAAGVPASEWVTNLIRTAIPGLAPTYHASSPRPDALTAANAELARLRDELREARKMTASQVAAVLDPPPVAAFKASSAAITVAINRTCAICVNRPADRMTLLDGKEYALCNTCLTERGNSGRYAYGGGFTPGAPSLSLSGRRK